MSRIEAMFTVLFDKRFNARFKIANFIMGDDLRWFLSEAYHSNASLVECKIPVTDFRARFSGVKTCNAINKLWCSKESLTQYEWSEISAKAKKIEEEF